MRKTLSMVVMLTATLFSSVCFGQNTNSTEDAINKVTEFAKSRYVGLKTVNVRVETNKEDVGSAVRVNCKYLISSFHILSADSVTAEIGDEKNQEIPAVGMSTRHDIVVLQSTTPNKNITPVEFASEVRVGEILVNYSNANGLNGFMRTYRVAKLKDGYILLDNPPIPGESGSGLFNLKGELAGIVDSSTTSAGGDRYYGSAVFPSVVKFVFDSLISEKVSCEK